MPKRKTTSLAARTRPLAKEVSLRKPVGRQLKEFSKRQPHDMLAEAAAGIIHNLVPVTLGNIVGGAGPVGAMYLIIYRTTFGKSDTT